MAASGIDLSQFRSLVSGCDTLSTLRRGVICSSPGPCPTVRDRLDSA